jgi:hypothetical protein
MPRYDDDDDDDRPTRGRRRRDDDDDDDQPTRSRRNRDDDDDRPRSRRRDDDDADDDDRPRPRATQKKGGGLAIILGILGVVLLLCLGGGGAIGYFAYQRVNEARDRNESSNNLKQIALACHEYSGRHGAFPTNSFATDQRPLLSWRVHILPYIGQANLHAKFNLNEPWDSQANKRLLSEMPSVFATPQQRHDGKWGTTTFYRGFAHQGALFEKPPQVNLPGMQTSPRGVGMMGIADGTSNTILVLEAGEAVEWTKPDDLDLSPGKPFPKLGGVRPNAENVIAAFADGSVRTIRRSTPELMWRGASTYRGGEMVLLD